MIDLVRPSIWRLLTRVGDRIADNKTSKTHKWQGLQPKVTFHENRLDKINIALTCQEWLLAINLHTTTILLVEVRNVGCNRHNYSH